MKIYCERRKLRLYSVHEEITKKNKSAEVGNVLNFNKFPWLSHAIYSKLNLYFSFFYESNEKIN